MAVENGDAGRHGHPLSGDRKSPRLATVPSMFRTTGFIASANRTGHLGAVVADPPCRRYPDAASSTNTWINRRRLFPMQIIRQLGSGEGMPTEAIRAATADRTTAAPLLLEAIERYVPTAEVDEERTFHRVPSARPVAGDVGLSHAGALPAPPDVELILGSATTETSHKIMASVFDGDPRPIYDIIQDSEADEFVRWRMFDALVMLAFRDELDRTEISDFLRSRFNDLQPRDHVCGVGRLAGRGRAAGVGRPRSLWSGRHSEAASSMRR